jgi:hypothetical protein
VSGAGHGERSGGIVDAQEAVEPVEVIERVGAIDIAKASEMVCVRLPHSTVSGRRVQQVWSVAADTGAILELGDRLVGLGVERVVMESTSVYWRPFVRHEALVNRAGVEGPCRRAVAAVWWSWG